MLFHVFVLDCCITLSDRIYCYFLFNPSRIQGLPEETYLRIHHKSV